MMMPIRRVLAALTIVAVGGCADLSVENLNAPDASRALSTPGDVESLIAGSFRTFYQNQDDYDGPGMMLGTMANEWTSSWGNSGMRDYSSEPRIALNNNDTYTYAYAIKDGWYNMYKAIKGATDGLRSINGGLKIVDASGVDVTNRDAAWAHFVTGISYGLLSNLYDRAFPYDETVDLQAGTLELQDYKQINAFAIAHLQKALEFAAKGPFTIPDNWVGPADNGVNTTSAEFIKIVHSYMARYIAQNARTPAERAAVDWTAVISNVDQGETKDWGPVGDAYTNWDPNPLQYYGVEEGWARMDLQAVGVADVSGAYQAWMAKAPAQRTQFLIVTPDRRVTGATPTTDGKYLQYHSTIPFRSSRGTYHFSNYSGQPVYKEVVDFGTGSLPAVDVDELRLLKAEGLFRKGDKAGAAALVNVTRVANGELPPIDANGASGAQCVPRLPNGQCGDVLEAIKYEKLLEAWIVSCGVRFFDERGWGDLVKDTPMQLPIPGKELEVLQLPYYTFGGGGNSSAPGGIYGKPVDFTDYIEPAATGIGSSTVRASTFVKMIDFFGGRHSRGARSPM